MDDQNRVDVKQSNKLIDIKYEFQEKVGFPRHEENCIYGNGMLNDNKYLPDCCVCNLAADESKNEMQIFIKTIDDKILTFDIEQSNKIRDVKLKIEEKTKLSADQQNLFFQGEILNDDDKSIDEYEICDKSVIDIVAGLKGGGIRINVETYDGKKFYLGIFSSPGIIYIKNEIQYKTGLHPDDQVLIYQGRVMDESDLRSGYLNRTNSFIGQMLYISHLTIFTSKDSEHVRSMNIFVATRPRAMEIFAKQIDGETFSFEVEKSDKIIDIKHKIQQKTGLLPNEQILINQGEILDNNYEKICGIMQYGGILDDDNKSIDDYPIFNRSVINIVQKSKNEIQIFIKISNKSIIPINIVKNSRIINLKLKISQKTGMQFDGNNLIYENEILDDDKLLIDYHIDDGCVISIDVDSGFSMFMQSIKSGSLKTVQQIYKNFQKMNNKPCSSSPLHYACTLNNAEIVEFLIERKFGINSYDRELNNPIHYACINNCVEILKILIQNGCCLEACDSYGMKPIHLACLHGNFQNVKLLIENRCDVECSDYLGRRPIHLACLSGNIDIVKLLIENNCEIDVLDKSNKSPFDIAEKGNLIDIIVMINEEISRRMRENMILELNLKCDHHCDHKICPTSLRNKTFDKGTKIKQEGTGEVYLCKLSQSSDQIVIKQILKDRNMDSKNIERNINRFIEKVNHERIVKYFGAITKEENIFIFMEYMSRGSIRSLISTNPLIISSKVIHFTMQILEGLQFLHSNKIIHRDIKPDNILLDNDENVKLADLGLGLSLYTTDGHTQHANTFCGTPYYMAPEIINEEEYSYSADIWSLGVTMIEMATGLRPYQTSPPSKAMYKIATTKTIPYELPASSSNKIKLFIDQMLLPEPSQRPSALDLINNLKII